jgi:hypothetical protein
MKENANPTVYNVTQSRDDEYYQNLIASKSISRFNFNPNTVNIFNPSSIPTSTERCIYLAMQSMRQGGGGSEQQPSSYEPLSLLHMAGMVPESNEKSLNEIHQQQQQTKPLNLPNIFESHGFVPYQQFKENEGEGGDETDKELSSKRDPIEPEEVFDLIRNIQDPEHPLTLEQLNVVNLNHVQVKDKKNNHQDNDDDNVMDEHDFSSIIVKFTPTIPHCSMATLIGLCIRVKLLRSLPNRFKVTVIINPGTHASESAINRQLNDKERAIAALENDHLLSVVNKCILNGMKSSSVM